MNRTAVVGVSAALFVTMLSASPAFAAGSSSSSTPVSTHSVVISGLDSPKQLSYDSFARDLYVGESGHGGDTCDANGLCSGTTGAITRIKRADLVTNGTPTRVVTGLLSVASADGTDASGPDAVVALAGQLAFATTGPAEVAAGAAALFRASASTGTVQPVADLGAYEAANDPDMTGTASDPSQIVIQGLRALVVDRAANDVLSINLKGAVSTFAVLPSIFLPEDNITVHAQPTAIAQDGHGHIFVGDLGTGQGGGRITTYDAGGKQLAQIGGFSGISGLAVAADGSLYVSEQSANLDENGVGGRLTKVTPSGTRTGVSVPDPAGVTVGYSNQIYVVVNSTSAATSATPGAVWRMNANSFAPIA